MDALLQAWRDALLATDAPRRHVLADAIQASVEDGAIEVGTRLPRREDILAVVPISSAGLSAVYEELRRRGILCRVASGSNSAVVARSRVKKAPTRTSGLAGRWKPVIQRAGSSATFRLIADLMFQDIQAGRLRPGQALPHRLVLAAQLGVTPKMVREGYIEALRLGLAERGKKPHQLRACAGGSSPLSVTADMADRWAALVSRAYLPHPRWLADVITADLARGRIKGGNMLPPAMPLAAKLGWSKTTVGRGYIEAAQRDLVVDHGKFCRIADGAETSAALRAAIDTLPDIGWGAGPPARISEPLPQVSAAAAAPVEPHAAANDPFLPAKGTPSKPQTGSAYKAPREEVDDWPIMRQRMAANDAPPVATDAPTSVFDMAGRPVMISLEPGDRRYRVVQREGEVVRCRAITEHETPEGIEREVRRRAKQKPPRPTKSANAMKLKNSRVWEPRTA